MRIFQTPIILTGLFIAGFLFRLWVAGLVPQPFVYDQDEYYGYALGMLKNGLHADLYRLYGYPLIITPFIYLFGVKSPFPWTVFHAIVDTTTALLVFWIAKKVFRKDLPSRQTRLARLNVPAWIAFGLYLFNPFSAGYVGVLLSEVVTTFLVALISVLTIHYFKKKSIATLWVLAILLGFLPQVRPAFILFALLVVCILVWTKASLVKRVKEKVVIGVTTFVLFSVPFWYTIAGNLVYYRQFSLLGVEPTFVRELYASLFIGRGMPFTDEKWGDWPVEAQNAWGAFASPTDAAGRQEVAQRHLQLATEIIRRDPLSFVQSRLAKMGYVWEKHFIYPYVMGKPPPLVKALTYWGNIAILVMAALGMVFAWKSKTIVVHGVFVLFLYISLAHVFSTSEERFSLPAYPWVAVFAGYGIATIASWFRKSWSAAPPGR